MKFLLLFMFVAVAVADQESETTQERAAQHLARQFRMDPMDSLECVNKSEATMEDVQYMKDIMDLCDTEGADMKSVKKASCAMVCCAQKIGVMVGGVVQEDELLKLFKKIGLLEESEHQMRNIVRICKEHVADISDECIANYKFMKCTHQKSQMLLVKHK